MLVVKFKMGVYVWEGGHKLFRILWRGDIPRQCSKALMTTKARPGPPEVSLGGPISALENLSPTHVLLCASVSSSTTDGGHRPMWCQSLTFSC